MQSHPRYRTHEICSHLDWWVASERDFKTRRIFQSLNRYYLVSFKFAYLYIISCNFIATCSTSIYIQVVNVIDLSRFNAFGLYGYVPANSWVVSHRMKVAKVIPKGFCIQYANLPLMSDRPHVPHWKLRVITYSSVGFICNKWKWEGMGRRLQSFSVHLECWSAELDC